MLDKGAADSEKEIMLTSVNHDPELYSVPLINWNDSHRVGDRLDRYTV